MKHSFFRGAGPAMILAMGATLGGCNMSWDMSNFEGVPLAELDMGGDPPAAILLAGPDKVVITSGSELAIEVEGDSSAAEAVRFDREGDTLEIGRDKDIFDGSGQAIIRVTMPPARELGIAGSGVIEADTMASEAEIDIAGSGDIGVTAITADRLEVNIAGAGDVSTAGTAKELEISIAGSGSAELAELKADTVEISIAGSGDIDVASDGTVSASIAGSGDINVVGNATCSLDAAGSGSLNCNPAPTADVAAIEDDSGDGEDAAAE